MADTTPTLNPGDKKSDELFEGPGKNLNKAETGVAAPTDIRNTDTASLESQGSGPQAAADFVNNVVGEKFNKVSYLKKYGPFGGILVTIAAAIFGITGLVAPGLSIVAFADTLTNALNDAEPALNKRSIAMLARKADGLKNSFAESSEGKCNIKCKFGTMSDTMLRNLKANGFEVEAASQKFGGRTVVTSITFPGNDPRLKVTNGAQFSEALKDPANASKFYRVFNPASYFLNSRFGSVINRAFGLDKLAKLSGSTKERVTESWRKLIGLQGASADEDPLKDAPEEERARSIGFNNAYSTLDTANVRFGRASNVVGAACTIYNTAKGANYAIKAAKLVKFAAVAFAIINLAHQIRAGDSPSPEAVEFAGNQLTQIDLRETIESVNGGEVDNPYYGKTVFDSNGWKMASDGDNPGPLSEEEQRYTITPTRALSSALATATGLIVGAGEPAVEVAHGLCATAASPVGAVAGGVITCGPEIGAALVAAIPSAGTSAAAGAAWCIGKVAVLAGLSILALTALQEAIKSAIISDGLTGMDETVVGAPNGDISYSGASSVYGVAALDVGMKAGDEEEIVTYAADTAEIRAQTDAIAKYDARSTPFDIYNQHSFLGSVASSINLAGISSSASLTSGISNVASIIPRSLNSLSTAAGAETLTVAQKRANLYKTANDASLAAIGAASDSFGNPSFVMSTKELNMDSASVAQWMIDKDYINENTGAPKAGKEYKKFVDNCVNRYDSNGIIPLGETSAAIEDDDYKWKVGLKCQEDSDELSRFRVFTMDLAVNTVMDEEPGAKQKQEVEEFVSPLRDGFRITSGFGSRIPPTKGASSWHAALDYINNSDPTVVSIGNGTVLSTNTFGTADNVVTVQHSDGLISEYWHMYQNDIVVKAGDEVSAGQKLGVMGASGVATGVHLHLVLNITEVESPEKYDQFSKNAGGRTPVGKFINPAQFFIAQGLSGYEGYE